MFPPRLHGASRAGNCALPTTRRAGAQRPWRSAAALHTRRRLHDRRRRRGRDRGLALLAPFRLLHAGRGRGAARRGAPRGAAAHAAGPERRGDAARPRGPSRAAGGALARRPGAAVHAVAARSAALRAPRRRRRRRAGAPQPAAGEGVRLPPGAHSRGAAPRGPRPPLAGSRLERGPGAVSQRPGAAGRRRGVDLDPQPGAAHPGAHGAGRGCRSRASARRRGSTATSRRPAAPRPSSRASMAARCASSIRFPMRARSPTASRRCSGWAAARASTSTRW